MKKPYYKSGKFYTDVFNSVDTIHLGELEKLQEHFKDKIQIISGHNKNISSRNYYHKVKKLCANLNDLMTYN